MRLVHSLVARMEGRLAATLEARAGELSEELLRIDGRLLRLESVLDHLVLLYLLHTPEVAPQLHAGAIASANRRYANFRQVVRDLLAKSEIDGARTGCL